MPRPSGTVFIATILLVSCGIARIASNKECFASHGKNGFCVPIAECPEIAAVASQNTLMEEQWQMLTAVCTTCDSHIEDPEPIVCCSATSVVPTTCDLPGRNDVQTEGFCVPVDNCTSWRGYSHRPFKSIQEHRRYEAAREPCNSKDSDGNVCCAKEAIIKVKEEVAPKCLQDRLGESNKHNGTYPSDSKFIAYIFYTMNAGFQQGNCGGSLITSEYVLTAAHCVEDHEQFDVFIGASNLYQFDPEDGQYYPDVEVVDVREKIIHENYNNFTIAYDIALLRLASSINFVKPVCIPTASEHYNVLPKNSARVLRTFGWGVNIKGIATSIKQTVTLQEISFQDCVLQKPPNANGTIDKDLNICTITISGHNAFTGYSGSPLMYRQNEVWFMVGLISYRYDVNNTLSNQYAFVSTSIGKANEDWIVEKILSSKP